MWAVVLIIVVLALVVLLIVFFIWLRMSAVERNEAVIKGELNNIHAREQVLAFLEEPVQGIPRWRALYAQSPESVKSALKEFYERPNPILISANVVCKKQENVLNCHVLLITPEFWEGEFVNEVVPVPIPDGVLIFKLRGEYTI